jgi:uncharacterized membrane protein
LQRTAAGGRIDREPQAVFAYLDELERHGEWQAAIVSVRMVTEGPTRVGSRAAERRKIPGGVREFTYEITAHEPPRKASFVGLDGPVRPHGTVTVEPVDGGTRSRLTLELDLVGHGLGKLIAPLARRDAAKPVPADQARLNERLEVDTSGEASPPDAGTV